VLVPFINWPFHSEQMPFHPTFRGYLLHALSFAGKVHVDRVAVLIGSDVATCGSPEAHFVLGMGNNHGSTRTGTGKRVESNWHIPRFWFLRMIFVLNLRPIRSQ
jgi:hypothetical protein